MPASRPVSELRTFLVEDSPLILENLRATLQELAPVRVVGCAHGEADALAWLQGNARACELVVVDIFLKQGSGLGVLQAGRSGHDAPRFVVLSNHATPEMRRRCLALGADRVFDKSNDIDALLEFCEHLARGEAP